MHNSNKAKFLILISALFAAMLLLASCKSEHFHQAFESKITLEPTCTESGEKTLYCDCGEIYDTETIDPIGHKSASSGYCDYCGTILIEYVSNGDGTCTITSCNKSLSGNVVLPDKSPDGDIITAIGKSAFSNCTKLTGITIPENVIRIDDGAFNGCSNLESITLPSVENNHFIRAIFDSQVPQSLKTVVITGGTSIPSDAFSGCSGLTSIDIPESVTSIGWYAFSGCSGLTSIDIPESVTTIGMSAFEGCSGLTSIDIPESVTSIKDSAFKGCSSLANITIPEGVKSIGEYVFSGCSGLASIDIPESVTSISSYAFSDCSGLISIEIPKSVTTIEGDAFWHCSGLTSITLPFIGASLNEEKDTYFGYIFGDSYDSSNDYVPENLKTVVITGGTKIPEDAFSGCSGLTSIHIPESVTHIGSGAFRGCSGLTSIDISGNVTSIGSGAFRGCYRLTSITLPFVGASLNGEENTHFGYIFDDSYDSSNDYVPESLKTVVITGGKSISECAFDNCSNIASITIPSSVTSIGEYAFSGCSGLTSIDIPGNVTSIGSGAFEYCSGLTSIDIPGNVTSIGSGAFRGCSGLTSITLPFVGASLNGKENTHFGYIFADSYYSSYVPESLKTVVITGGKSISENAFGYCDNIASITIPSSVTSIDASAFYHCYGLAEIINHSSITITSEYALEVHNGESKLVAYDGYIFYPYNNTNYYVMRTDSTKSLLPESYNGEKYAIKQYACYNQSSLNEITIPEKVCKIGDYAFYNCYKLLNVTVPTSVTQIGKGAFSYCSNLASITLPFIGESKYNTANSYFKYIFDFVPSTLSDVNITSCTGIPDNAFYGCSNINNITLPSSVNSIGDSAFYGCTGLTDISNFFTNVTSIGESAFYGCTGLTAVNIPTKLTSIPENAFYGCTGLKSIIVPGNIKSIGASAFAECSSLEEIKLPFVGNSTSASEKYWLGYIFGATSYTGNTSAVPATLKKVEIYGANKIASSAFYGCNNITEISIPDTVSSIGIGAFKACDSLNTLTIPFVGGSKTENTYFQYIFGTENSDLPESVKNVIVKGGTIAGFHSCGYIEQITLPESIEKIYCTGCASLQKLHIPYNTTYCELVGCISIEEITVSNGNSYYKSIDGNLYDNSGTTLCYYSPAKIDSIFIIPDGVTYVQATFAGCSNLTELIIPASVTSLPNVMAPSLTKFTVLNGNSNYRSINGDLYSVDGKTLLSFAKGKSEVEFAYGITTIEVSAFSDAANITTVVIPDTVTSIGAYAFSHCENLTSVIIPTSVKTLGSGVFNNCTNATIYCEATSQPNGWDSTCWYGSSKKIEWGYVEEE